MRRSTVLFVCHANICRSPMAERLARHAGADIVALSAGTHALDGAPMHPGAAAILREWGVDAAGFASRALTADLVAGADLILTATRQQRAISVTLCPSALRRAFTIRQFGRLSAGLDAGPALPPATGLALPQATGPVASLPAKRPSSREDLRPSGLAVPRVAGPASSPGAGVAGSLAGLLDAVARARGGLQPVPVEEDDLADPVNGTLDDIRACAHQIRDSLRAALTGRQPSAGAESAPAG